MNAESARIRIGYGMLMGLAGLVLCCLPVGAVGTLLPLSVLGGLKEIPEGSERDALKRYAYLAIGLCALATVASFFAYLFAIITGCD